MSFKVGDRVYVYDLSMGYGGRSDIFILQSATVTKASVNQVVINLRLSGFGYKALFRSFELDQLSRTPQEARDKMVRRFEDQVTNARRDAEAAQTRLDAVLAMPMPDLEEG